MLAMALLCRGLALLCLLPLKCYSYRVGSSQDSRRLHRAEDEIIPPGTKQMFKGVARSVGRMNQLSQMYRNNLFRMHQRNLHLRASPVKPNLMRDFHQMQRFQNLGKYRFSTFPGRKAGKTLLPQNLMPMVSRRLMSTKEAKQFGKVFTDYMAKRDMKDARQEQVKLCCHKGLAHSKPRDSHRILRFEIGIGWKHKLACSCRSVNIPIFVVYIWSGNIILYLCPFLQ